MRHLERFFFGSLSAVWAAFVSGIEMLACLNSEVR